MQGFLAKQGIKALQHTVTSALTIDAFDMRNVYGTSYGHVMMYISRALLRTIVKQQLKNVVVEVVNAVDTMAMAAGAIQAAFRRHQAAALVLLSQAVVGREVAYMTDQVVVIQAAVRRCLAGKTVQLLSKVKHASMPTLGSKIKEQANTESTTHQRTRRITWRQLRHRFLPRVQSRGSGL